MVEISELDQQNKELLGRIDELQSEVKLLNEDIMARDDRIDKLNEVWTWEIVRLLIFCSEKYKILGK